MYFDQSRLASEARTSLMNSHLIDNSEDTKSELEASKYIKLSRGGVKRESPIICRIAKNSEASRRAIRVLIDVKDYTTISQFKEIIVERYESHLSF